MVTRLGFYTPLAPASMVCGLARRGLTSIWKGAGPDGSHTRAQRQVQFWLPAVTLLPGSSSTTQNHPSAPISILYKPLMSSQ